MVDSRRVATLPGEAPGRVLGIVEAKIIEADPAAHQAKVEAEKRRRFVSLTRTDETGLRHVIARVTAGDAAYVDAVVSRVADILAARPEHADAPRDLLRSFAFAWLARPAELLRLLLEHTDPDPAADPDPTDPEDSDPGVEPAPAAGAGVPRRPARRPGPDQPRPAPAPGGPLRAPARGRPLTGAAARARPRTAPRPRGGPGRGPRPTRPRPSSPSCSATPGGRAAGDRPAPSRSASTATSTPPGSRNASTCATPATCSRTPHGSPASSTSTTASPTGPRVHPGRPAPATANPSAGPDTAPRPTWATIAPPCPDGAILWRSPHGLHRLVDHHGTHRLDPDEADALTGPDPIQHALVRLLIRRRARLI